jgi:hypothetical protein
VAARQRPDAPLGTLIFRAGLVPADQLEDALEEGIKRGRRLGEILIERGLISEADLARILAGQKGLPFLEAADLDVDPEAVTLLPEEKARLYRALPVRFDNGVPVVAITDPTNDSVIREVTTAMGLEPYFVVAAKSELVDAISAAYAPTSSNGSLPGSEGLRLVEPAAVEAYEAPEPADEPIFAPHLAKPETTPPALTEVELEVEPVLPELEVEPALPELEVEPPLPELEVGPALPELEVEPPLPEPEVGPELAVAETAEPVSAAIAPLPEPPPMFQDPVAFEAPVEAAPAAPEVELEPVADPEPFALASEPVPAAPVFDLAPAEPMVTPAEEILETPEATIAQPVEVAATEPAVEAEPAPAAPVFDLAPAEPLVTPAEEILETPEATVAQPVEVAPTEPAVEVEPVLVPEIDVQVELAPAPESAAEPVLEPEAEHTPEPEAQLEPEVAPEQASEVEAAAEPPAVAAVEVTDVATEAPADAADGPVLQVVVRLTSGERVVVAETTKPEDAAEVARGFIRDLAAKDPGDWPLVNGRFLRPDTILSVDIAESGSTG